MDTHHAPRSRALGRSGGAVLVALSVWASACSPPVLTQLLEAQRLGSALHVAFSRATAAGDRAVMATDDETAAAAVDEARALMATVESQQAELEQILQALGYQSDLRTLADVRARVGEYRRLTEDVLTLVLENTNVKAQRLAFGPAAEAADALHSALLAAVEMATGDETCRAQEQALGAWAAVLEIRTLYPQHIAEPEDAVMSAMEERMTAAAGVARAAVDALKLRLPAASSQLWSAQAALHRFMTTHAEIIDLSRRNSNVRALALSMGRRRMLAADTEVQLEALEKGLAQHEFKATR